GGRRRRGWTGCGRLSLGLIEQTGLAQGTTALEPHPIPADEVNVLAVHVAAAAAQNRLPVACPAESGKRPFRIAGRCDDEDLHAITLRGVEGIARVHGTRWRALVRDGRGLQRARDVVERISIKDGLSRNVARGSPAGRSNLGHRWC